MKQAARLTSSLLARKGFAAPSPESVYALQDALLNKPISSPASSLTSSLASSLASPLTSPTVESAQPASPAVAKAPVAKADTAKSSPEKDAAVKDAASVKKDVASAKEVAPSAAARNGCDTASECKHKGIAADHSGKRVAMTLRLDSDRHLKLRVLSAHANMSSQEILTAALDEYLSREADAVELRHCDCLHSGSR